MTKINSGFIGNNITNAVVEYTVGDDEERFRHNLTVQPDDWYYRTHKITYNYNLLGHRSKNIKEIDLDNYILFAGCSHTEGVGLELDKTYPHIVSAALDKDYYNLGVSGTGIDVMSHNLVMWFKTVPKLPKALVIMQPEPTRFVTSIEQDYLHERYSCDGHEDTARFIVSGEEIDFFNTRYRLQMMLIYNLFNQCPIIEMAWQPDENKEEVINLESIDLARDIAHSGIKSNKLAADEVINRLR